MAVCDQAGEKLRQACGRRFGTDADADEIGHGRQQAADIVAEQPQRGVALVAQEPAHLSRRVAMIDAERSPGWQLADGADAVLRFEQPPVLAANRAYRAVGGELLLAVLSILGLSPPVLLVAESHRRSRQHARLDRPHRMQGTPKSPWLAGRSTVRAGREGVRTCRGGA